MYIKNTKRHEVIHAMGDMMEEMKKKAKECT